MGICTIVAEYNPFHSGHMYHISQTKQILGESSDIVAIMSGNYVQRGDFAIVEKYARAKAAVLSGVDLVLELPLTAALSSAEGFAFGALSVADALGCVSNLSFGCENDNLEALNRLAEVIDKEEFSLLLKSELFEGVSFPVARQNAVKKIMPQYSGLLEKPNNILAIEYIKAIKKLDSNIIPIGVCRQGASHDSIVADSDFASASFIRELIKNGKTEKCANYMPQSSIEVFKREHRRESSWGNKRIFRASTE